MAISYVLYEDVIFPGGTHFGKICTYGSLNVSAYIDKVGSKPEAKQDGW
jgi:hypothetical protein